MGREYTPFLVKLLTVQQPLLNSLCTYAGLLALHRTLLKWDTLISCIIEENAILLRNVVYCPCNELWY